MTDAHKFHRDIVVPTMDEFAADPLNERRGYLSIVVIDALAAHIYRHAIEAGVDPFAMIGADYGKGDGAFRAALADTSDEFRLIRDIAKAQKHVRLENWNPMVHEADQVGTR